MITVYSADEVDFSSNGLGTLFPESCLVTEKLNGEYEVTLVHPLDEYGKFLRIQEGNILRVSVPAGKTPYIRMSEKAQREIYKIMTDGRRLYLRTAPDMSAKGICTYRPGTEVVVIDNTTSEQWSEVVTPDDKHGWMWSDNLEYVRTEGSNADETVHESVTIREQPFRIYKVVSTLKHITAYARHIFYDLMDNNIETYAPHSNATGMNVFKKLCTMTADEHEFVSYSNLTTTAEEFEVIDKNPVEAILGTDGLIEHYGGELMRDWWDVYLVERIGEDTPLQIREGKNLTGISYSIDSTDTATRIVPKGTDASGNVLYLPEKYIDSPNIENYPHPKRRVIEVKEAKEQTSGDAKRSKNECYELMRQAVADEFENGCDLPEVTLNVNFVDCAETEEYRQYRNLQGIHLGDTVRVYAQRIRVNVKMRMVQYSYNCLTRRYVNMTLGTPNATLNTSIKKVIRI